MSAGSASGSGMFAGCTSLQGRGPKEAGAGRPSIEPVVDLFSVVPVQRYLDRVHLMGCSHFVYRAAGSALGVAAYCQPYHQWRQELILGMRVFTKVLFLFFFFFLNSTSCLSGNFQIG